MPDINKAVKILPVMVQSTVVYKINTEEGIRLQYGAELMQEGTLLVGIKITEKNPRLIAEALEMYLLNYWSADCNLADGEVSILESADWDTIMPIGFIARQTQRRTTTDRRTNICLDNIARQTQRRTTTDRRVGIAPSKHID